MRLRKWIGWIAAMALVFSAGGICALPNENTPIQASADTTADGAFMTDGSGDGSADKPYLIDTAQELYYISTKTSSFKDKYIEMTADIDLSEYGASFNGGKGWPGISNFSGYFDGNGYTVSKLYINETSSGNRGLFNNLTGGGINVSTDFNPRFFAGTIAVERNVLVRCGSQKALDSFAEAMNLGAIWINTLEGNNNHAVVLVKDNVILDSTHTGISINGDGVTSRVVLEGNLIDTTETYGVQIYEGAVGRAVSVNNVIVNTMLDEYKNDASTQFELTFYNKEIKTEYDYVEIPRETITTYSNEKPAAYTVAIAVAGAAILAEVAAITVVLIRRKREK